MGSPVHFIFPSGDAAAPPQCPIYPVWEFGMLEPPWGNGHYPGAVMGQLGPTPVILLEQTLVGT